MVHYSNRSMYIRTCKVIKWNKVEGGGVKEEFEYGAKMKGEGAKKKRKVLRGEWRRANQQRKHEKKWKRCEAGRIKNTFGMMLIKNKQKPSR